MTAKYSLLYVDPPWSYGNTISNGAAADHYSTMKLIDIKRLPPLHRGNPAGHAQEAKA